MIRIIHVDDSKEEIILTQLHLQKLLGEHEYATFIEVEKALEYIHENGCDVIISDFQMPVKDGMDFLKAVREYWPDLPFVFLTGQGNEELAVKAFRSGANEYYTKNESFAHYQRIANSIKNLHESHLSKQQHRKAIDALQANETLMETILSASPVGIAFVQNRILKWANKQFFEMFGCEESDVVGKTTKAFYPSEEEYIAFGNLQSGDILNEGFSNQNITLRTKHDQSLEVNAKARPIDLANPDDGIIVVLTDITARKKAEEHIRFQSNMLKSVEQAVIATDLQGIISFMNPFAEKLYGWKEEEVIGKSVFDITVPVGQESNAEEILELLSTGKSWSGEFRVRRKDHSEFEVAISNSPYYDSNGELQGIIGISSDISHRKKAEEELRRSEENYRSLFENSPVGIFRTTSDGKPVHVNPEMARILGADSTEDAISHYKNLSKHLYVYPERRKEFISRLKESGEVKNFEYLARKPDGDTAWINMNARISQKKADGFFVIDGFASDVSDLKETREKLTESKTRLDLAVKSAEIGIWDLDIVNDELIWDDRMYVLYGVKREEYEAAYTAWQQGLHPDDRQRAHRDVEEAIQDNKEFDTEFRIVTPGGEVRHIKAYASVVKDGHNKPLRMIGINYDITESRKAQAKIIESEERYRKLFDDSPVAILRATDKGELLIVNRAAVGMWGYESKEHMIETFRNPDNLLCANPDVKNHFISSLMEKGNLKQYETIALRNDGSTFWVSFDAKLTMNQSGEGGFIDIYAIDIDRRKTAEQAARESIQRFKNILDNAAVLGLTLDKQGRIVFANDYLLELTGWGREEIFGKPWIDLLIPDEQKGRVREFFKETMKLEEIPAKYTHYDNNILTRDGRELTISWTNVLDKDSTGKVLGESSIGINVTEKVQIQEQLEDAYSKLANSENQYHAYMENSPVAIFVSDENGKYVDVNLAACEMLRYTREELLNRSLGDVDITGEAQDVVSESFRILKEVGSYNKERILQGKDGSFVHVDLRAVRISGTRFIGFCLDISERKKLEETQKQFDVLLEKAEELAKVGTWEFDSQSCLFTLSKGLQRILDLKERCSDVETMIGLTHPDDIEILQTEWDKSIRTGGSYNVEQRIIKGNGDIAYLKIRGVPQKHSDGTISIVGVTQDITDVMRSTERIRKTTIALTEVNEELSAFAYSVSHDLKAPVRQTLGFLNLVKDEIEEKINEKSRKTFSMMKSTLDNMNLMLADYLKLSRTMHAELDFQELNLTSIVQQIAEELKVSEPDRNVEFSIQSGLKIESDRVLIRSVLQNLIGNAWKYTANCEKANISFGFEKSEKAFFVRDNGIGFEMTFYERLFKPFQRLHSHLDYQGSGIGLSISQRAIRRLGGRIWATSEPDKGSVFYFTLNQ